MFVVMLCVKRALNMLHLYVSLPKYCEHSLQTHTVKPFPLCVRSKKK